jgi:Zn-dependent protease with chaperone function
MDEKAILDHQFVVAAYVITWAVQLSYVAYLALKWRAQSREPGPTESKVSSWAARRFRRRVTKRGRPDPPEVAPIGPKLHSSLAGIRR